MVTTKVGAKAQSAKGTKLGKNNETTLLRSALCLCAFATLCLSSYSKMLGKRQRVKVYQRVKNRRIQ